MQWLPTAVQGWRGTWRWGLLLVFWLCGHALAAAPISLCVDDNFPPFEYADPVAARQGQHQVRGVTISLVEQILQPQGIAYHIEWSPFLRCIERVKAGSINIGLDAYYDPRRAQQLSYSTPYFSLTPQYFYSRTQFPNGLPIRNKQDLKNYKGCGILGYSYLHYGLTTRDLSNAESLDDGGLVRMIKHKRCDYFVEELEVIQGLALTGNDYLRDPDIGHGPVPDAAPPKLYFFFTKDNPTTQWLLPLFNRQLTLLTKQGRVQDLVARELRRATTGAR